MRESGNLWYREYEDVTLEEQKLDQALSAIWVNRLVPAITLELGPLDTFSVDQSLYAQQTLRNVLVAASVIGGDIIPDPLLTVFSGAIWQRQELIYSGANSGYLRPVVRIGEAIQRGMTLAEIVQPDGEIVDTVVAPAKGIHFIWHNEYRILPGSTVGVFLVKD